LGTLTYWLLVRVKGSGKKNVRYACHVVTMNARFPQVYTYYGPSVNGVAFVARLVSAIADVTNGETHTPGYETIKPPRACLEMYMYNNHIKNKSGTAAHVDARRTTRPACSRPRAEITMAPVPAAADKRDDATVTYTLTPSSEPLTCGLDPAHAAARDGDAARQAKAPSRYGRRYPRARWRW
jgi:hypothetical protein